MEKVIVKFLRPHGRHNAGEIAGFMPETAAKLVAGAKPIAKAYDAKAEEEVAKAAAANSADIAAREKALADREAELKAREEALAAAEKGGKAGAAGAPPAQGQAQK